jgi:hypothetical protein
MPCIDCLAFDLSDRKLCVGKLPGATTLPLDDLPLVSSVREVVDLLRTTAVGHGIELRVVDFPHVTVSWRRWTTTALVTAYVRRRLVHANLVMLGLDPADELEALNAATESFRLAPEEALQIRSQPRPLLVRFSFREGEDDFSGLLGLVVVTPAMCELCGVE